MLQPYTPEIRFADIDAMGHVNNAVYLSYFEQARIHFFSQIIMLNWDWRKQGILVARNEINYKLPVYHKDHIVVLVGCSAVGSKSFTLSYEVKRGEEVCSYGSSVLVCFDHETQQSAVIPDLWREKLLLIRSTAAQ
jgi:acyl-CoA thioester hydrolase